MDVGSIFFLNSFCFSFRGVNFPTIVRTKASLPPHSGQISSLNRPYATTGYKYLNDHIKNTFIEPVFLDIS